MHLCVPTRFAISRSVGGAERIIRPRPGGFRGSFFVLRVMMTRHSWLHQARPDNGMIRFDERKDKSDVGPVW